MILSDRDIANELLNNLKIIPVPKDNNIQSCSVDLHLGDELKTINGKSIDILHDTYKLKPNEFLLGSTLEYVEIPPHLCAMVDGRSSIGRLGILVHVSAGFVDAGYCGNITLEIKNLSDKEFELESGMSICQLLLIVLSSEPLRLYGSDELGSKYQHSVGTVASKYER